VVREKRAIIIQKGTGHKIEENSCAAKGSSSIT